jgi:hypothetical protein
MVMKVKRILPAALLLIVAGLTCEAQETKIAEGIPTVAYCDLIREPAMYDQKVVRVKVTYIVGFEASVMYDLACGRKDTWVEFDPASETSTNPKVLKRFRRMANAQAERTRGGGINYPTRRVEVVWVGRFQGIKRTQTFGGQSRSFGFGHLNGFDYQFNVQRIEEVKAVPASVPWQ